MNEFEGNFSDILLENTKRELEEELNITSNQQNLNYIGLINDDSDEVGKYHIGLLATLELDEDAEVTVREVDQLKGSWINIVDLKDEETYERLESWSKFSADLLYANHIYELENLDLKTNIKE